ncbi:DNA replication complex GINS protein PSF1 [Entomortierella beljakovae]|nr:DNA replication complex GINS protein PSF1 [Entomortierella beljakovae]
MYGEEASKLARETKRTTDHFPPYNDSLVRSITREIRHLYESCQGLIREYNIQKERIETEVRQQWHQQYGTPLASQGSVGSSSRQQQQQQQHSNNTLNDDHNSSENIVSSNKDSSMETLNELALPSSSSAATIAATLSDYTLIDLQEQIERALLPVKQVFWTKYLVHSTPLQRNKRILMAYHYQRIEKVKELAWAYNSLPESSRRLLSPDEIVFFNEYEKQCRGKYTNNPAFGEVDLGLGMISPPKEVFITVRVIKDCGDIVTESGSTLSLKKNSEHFVKRGDVERLITQGYLLHVA